MALWMNMLLRLKQLNATPGWGPHTNQAIPGHIMYQFVFLIGHENSGIVIRDQGIMRSIETNTLRHGYPILFVESVCIENLSFQETSQKMKWVRKFSTGITKFCRGFGNLMEHVNLESEKTTTASPLC